MDTPKTNIDIEKLVTRYAEKTVEVQRQLPPKNTWSVIGYEYFYQNDWYCRFKGGALRKGRICPKCKDLKRISI